MQNRPKYIERLYLALRNEIRRWSRYTEEEREEIASDTIAEFLKFYRKNRQFPLRTARWLRKTAKNLGFQIRKRKERSESLIAAVDEIPFEMKSQIRHINLNRSEGWGRLDERHQQLLHLRYVDELTLSEAARRLNMNRSTAKSWIKRDLNRLSKDTVLMQIAHITTNSTRS